MTRRTYVASFLGLTLPVPRWTLGGFGLLAIAGVALVLYKQALPPPDVLTLKQANEALAAEVEEYGRHMGEPPEQTFADDDGSLKVRVYDDHCVLIQQVGPTGRPLTRLVLDLTRNEPRRASALLPVVEAAGRCLMPHPGAFEWRYGAKKDACWIEVWRRWADGCEHVQLFNACSKTWDVDEGGAPRVKWTNCIH